MARYNIYICCNSVVPGVRSGKGEPTSGLMDNAEFEDEAHGDRCVIHWLQSGYPMTIRDEYGRCIRLRLAPGFIQSIRFWKPFEHELELGKVE